MFICVCTHRSQSVPQQITTITFLSSYCSQRGPDGVRSFAPGVTGSEEDWIIFRQKGTYWNVYLQILRGRRHWKHKLHSPAELISCCSVIALGKLEREEGGGYYYRLHQGIGKVMFCAHISQLFDKTQAEFGVRLKALRIAELRCFYFLRARAKTVWRGSQVEDSWQIYQFCLAERSLLFEGALTETERWCGFCRENVYSQ